MRVAHVFNHAEIVGGGELSFLELIEELRRQGIESLAMVAGEGEVAVRLRALQAVVEIVTMPSLRGAGLLGAPGTVQAWTRIFRQQRVDLVHTNGARCTLYAALAARCAGVPCLWHVRVLERDLWLDRLRGRLASGVIANSNAVAQSLTPLLPGNMRVDIIPNGLALNRLASTAPAEVRRLFDLPQGPVLLAAGRVTREKGYEVLAAARGLLSERGLSPSIVVAGAIADAACQAEAQALVDARPGGLWRWAGAREDVAGLMKSATALVLPSHREGFGRVVLEAWACGLPVVSTRQGGPAELIQDGVNGLLIEPNSPQALCAGLERLLNDTALRHTLSEGGRKAVQPYSIQATARQTLDAYQRCLQSFSKGWKNC